MAYVPTFVTKATVADFHPLITVAMISDTMIRSAERRVRRDLLKISRLSGVSITVEMLTATEESAYFLEDLEDAAMYACLSLMNSTGAGNTTVGPITSVSGDGMAKTHGYITGSSGGSLGDILATAEEFYQRTMRDIIQEYLSLGYGPTTKPIGRYNEIYDEDYWAEGYDSRKEEGNYTDADDNYGEDVD